MSGAHSILAPSSAAIWMQCPASVRMRLPYMNQPGTPESMEGDAAHWLACFVATNGPRTPVYEGDAHEQHVVGYYPTVGDKAPNGVKIDQDMIDAAELFAEVCGPGCTHERKVAGPSIHPALDGTPDADRMLARVLRVLDFKYGHRYVEVFECWQLLAYVVSLLDSVYSRDDVDVIEFTIVQPRAYHPEGPVRTWRITVAELYEYTARLHSAAHRAVDQHGNARPDAPAQTGPECRDCEARHECTLFQTVAARAADEAGKTERFNLPPVQLGAELSYLDEALQRLKARRDGLAIQAESHIRAGRNVQGYNLEPGRSTEKWRDDVTVDEVASFGNMFGVVLCRDVELRTPTQARAELKRRKLPPDLLDGYSIRPRGALSLARVSTITAQKVFKR